MRLKSAPQKLNFLIVKGIQKRYTLNCSHKCLCTLPHGYATSFSRKQFFCETNNIFYNLGNRKWDKTNTSKIDMRSSWTVLQILLMQQLFAFKRFCMEMRLSNILKTTNATKFIKTILQSTYKVVLGTNNLAAPMWLVFLLRAVEF